MKRRLVISIIMVVVLLALSNTVFATPQSITYYASEFFNIQSNRNINLLAKDSIKVVANDLIELYGYTFTFNNNRVLTNKGTWSGTFTAGDTVEVVDGLIVNVIHNE